MAFLAIVEQAAAAIVKLSTFHLQKTPPGWVLRSLCHLLAGPHHRETHLFLVKKIPQHHHICRPTKNAKIDQKKKYRSSTTRKKIEQEKNRRDQPATFAEKN